MTDSPKSLTTEFPDEFASVEEKESANYHLQYARAAWFASSRYGGRVFFGDTEFDALVELAQGRQSVDNIRRLMGFQTAPNNAKGADQGDLAWIDVQVLPLAQKYVNKAVAKLQRNKYDVQLSAVDLLSVEESKQYSSKIKAIYMLKDFYENMQVDAQAFFPDIDLGLLPEHPDELIFNYNVNPKLKKIIDGEKSLKLIQQINDMEQVMREFDWDMVVKGRAHLHCWLDENFVPRICSINSKYWSGSYVENEDFSKQEYAFFIEFITINQFKKEAEYKLPKEKIDEVINGYAFQNTQLNYSGPYKELATFDGLSYIPVMRYYFLSNDNRAFEMWKNSKGGPMIEERPYEYQMSSKKAAQGREVVKNCYTSCYGGTWVVDSTVVYNNRMLDMPRLNLVNQRLPIITFAPNQKEGRVVSLVAQMVEPLYMINVAWNKIKHILADGFLGVLELDFNAMENISLAQGGESWTPRQVYEHFLKTKRLIKRQTTSPYGQPMGKAIEESAAGLQMADYFNTIRQAIVFLDDLTGSTVVDSVQVPDRMTTKVMEANVSAGSESIEYLINGHEQAYKQASHVLLLLTQAAKRNKAKITGMIPALGKYTTEYFEVPDDIAYCEYGLFMERKPSPEEWADFYLDLQDSRKTGKINASDSAFIREIDNLKVARQVLANRERINEAKAAKMIQEEREFQMKIAKAAGEEKVKLEMIAADKKMQNDRENMILQARIDEALLKQELMMKGMNERELKSIDERIKKQAGVDTIIKEFIRANAAKYEVDKKNESDALTTAMSVAQKAQSDTEKAKAMAKRPKSTVTK